MCSRLKAALLIFLAAFSSSSIGETWEMLQTRPLKFPEVKLVDNCPVSMGSREVVPHDAENIFCARCAWHGNGPVYLTFAWAHFEQQDARFVLTDVRNVTDGVYTVKTPLVATPDYEGPILIRGQRLDVGIDNYTLFPGKQPDNMEKLQARPSEPPNWSFWGWGMKLSSPGCYGLQLDTITSSSVIVFEATE